MKIVFSDHAKSQRVERKIPRKYVLATIKSPQNRLNSFRNRQLLQRKFSGKILEVVTVKEEEENLTVVTQYWLEKEKS